MKQLVTTAIVLSRTDYGEADRILTLLTPEYGKLALLAKGVRKVKSKLAGGIELFSISEITFIKGRGDVGTLVSARLVKHYDQVVTDLDRTMLGYELIKQLNKTTADEPEPAYFDLLHQAFEALNDTTIPLLTIRFWFSAQLLRLGGHAPNLHTDDQGTPLVADHVYAFDYDHMAFRADQTHGQFNAGHIKFLRLVFAGNTAKVLTHVQGSHRLVEQLFPLVQVMTTHTA